MHKSLLTAAAIAALSLASSASAQEKLKFAVFTPEAEMTHQVVMKPWAERVSKESGGTLDIQTFPNGALGRNPGLQSKMLQDGVADIAWVIPSYTPGVYLDDDVFEIGPWDAVRVAPAVMRAFAAGPDGLEFLAYGAPAVVAPAVAAPMASKRAFCSSLSES